MIDLHSAVVDLLKVDATLTAMLPGGIWNRELKQEGPGNTAAAWGLINPSDPLSPTGLLPALVVRDAGEFASGFRFGGNAKVMLFIYVPANDAGRALIAAVDAHIRLTLGQTSLGVASGDGEMRWGEFRVGFRTPILDERAYGGMMFCGWDLTFMTSLMPAALR